LLFGGVFRLVHVNGRKPLSPKPIFAKFVNAEGDQIRPAEKLRL
jgi:hypothetical protein